MSNHPGGLKPPRASALPRRQVAFMLCVGLFSVPWLMGQSSCFLRSPIASKTKTYGQNAEQLYKYARQLIKGGNFKEARTAFQRIKTKYPFSAFATLADLGIGDAYFKAGKFLRAVDIYKLFSKLHPTHPKAGYAAFMVGEGYEKLRPWEWFLVPSSYERDATHTRQAIQAFREFLQRFPKHKLAPKAQQKLLFSLNLLAKHEMHVANFYRRKGRHRAVLWRMEFLLQKYPKVKLAAEARFRMAESLTELKRYQRAHKVFLEVSKLHPKSRFAKDAQSRANALRSKLKQPPARRVAPKPAARPAPRPAARPAPRPAARPAPRREAPPVRREPAKAPVRREPARPAPLRREPVKVPAKREAAKPAPHKETTPAKVAPAARKAASKVAPVVRKEAAKVPVKREAAKPAARKEAAKTPPKREAAKPAARRDVPKTPAASKPAAR